jgi:hypothetical protein
MDPLRDLLIARQSQALALGGLAAFIGTHLRSLVTTSPVQRTS